MTNSDPPISGARPKGGSAKGLPSLAKAREERAGRQSPIWNWLLPLVALVLLVWWRVDAMRTAELRNGLLARQREVASRLGPRWFGLRDKVEAWTAECGAANFTERPNDKLLAGWDFRGQPGIYLRLGQKHATSPDAIRKAAMASLHDGFSSCMFTASNPSPVGGARCENTQDCGPGELCNEFSQCAPPSQPYNLRIAYRSTYVLGDEWLTGIQATRGELQLRGAIASFDAIEKYDLPIATDLVTKAAFFMVVVDEPSDKPEPAPADGGDATEDRSIPSGPHMARVCLWRIAEGEKLVALRREATGELRGGRPQTEATQLARQRQANGCALALEVREAMGGVASQ